MLVVERGAGGGGGVQGIDGVLSVSPSAARMSALAQSLDQHLAPSLAVNVPYGNGEVRAVMDWTLDSADVPGGGGYGGAIGVYSR